MASALWNKLKQAQKIAPVNVVNGDLEITVIDESGAITTERVNAAPLRDPGERRVKFRPLEKQDHPADNSDLVGDIIITAKTKRPSTGGGRPRLYPNNAEKQRAYRARLKQG